MAEYLCKKCGETKPQIKFRIRNGIVVFPCKECQRVQHQEYRASHPEYVAKQSFLSNVRRLGIIDKTNQELWEMFLAHSGLCDICEKPEPEGSKRGRLTVDHDHITLRFRGFICYRCNIMLGHAREDPEILRLGAAYIDGQVNG